MSDPLSAQRPKLPVWQLVGASYAITAARISEVAQRRWLVVLGLALVAFAFDWLIFPIEQAWGNVGRSWASQLVLPLIATVFAAMVEVPWIRRLAHDEPMTGDGLSLDPRVLAYAIWNAAIWLPLLIDMLVIGDLKTGSTDGDDPRALIAIVALVFILLASSRLSLKLVAVALSDGAASVESIWQRTSGNMWRLLGGFLVASAPAFVLAAILPSDTTTRLGFALSGAVSNVFAIVLGLVTTTYYVLAYRHVMGQPTTQP